MITMLCDITTTSQSCVYSGDFFTVFLFVIFGLLFLQVVKFFMIFTNSLF